ncbi:MAG: hypothetical protein GXO62_07080 [Epsilonproteobacteria bacterium]|nr:hypothetical protein [Campylobacterota bacterium]
MYKRCPHCHYPNQKQNTICERCSLSLNKDINKALAYAISGLMFYIPANIYPIIETTKFYYVKNSTIIGGIFTLWEDGDYPIAVIVFLASVLIPVMKFFIIFYLVFSVKLKDCTYFRLKLFLYRFIKVTGHYSILDIFVMVVLSGLVSFSSLRVEPKSGALYFLIMVIFTILSAKNIELRDYKKECREKGGG